MQATIFGAIQVRLGKAAIERINRAQAGGLCVACMEPLGSGTVKRGCHERCYRATLRAIGAGKTTEVERVRAGKFLQPQEPGRHPSNPVSKEFA